MGFLCARRLYTAFYWVEIHKPLAARGQGFYAVVFYILTAMLFVSVGICMCVAAAVIGGASCLKRGELIELGSGA